VQDVVSDISQVSFIPRPAPPPPPGGSSSMITRVTTQLKQLKRPTALLLPHAHLRKNRRRPRRRDEAVEVHDGRKEGDDMRDNNAAISDGIMTVIQDNDDNDDHDAHENGQQSLNEDGDNNNNINNNNNNNDDDDDDED
ncbi:hypothetical protein FOZ62_008259, partial [Perkinsus olseni]